MRLNNNFLNVNFRENDSFFYFSISMIHLTFFETNFINWKEKNQKNGICQRAWHEGPLSWNQWLTDEWIFHQQFKFLPNLVILQICSIFDGCVNMQISEGYDKVLLSYNCCSFFNEKLTKCLFDPNLRWITIFFTQTFH